MSLSLIECAQNMLREQYWGGQIGRLQQLWLDQKRTKNNTGWAGQPFATTPVNSKSTVCGCCFLDIFVENRQNFLRSRLRRSRFYFYIFWWEGRAQKTKGSRGRSFGAIFVFGVRQPFGGIFKGFRPFFFPKISNGFFVN